MSGIKRIHSNLYFVKDVSRTADFYKSLSFDTIQSNNEVRIKLGDFTMCFIDESRVQIDKEVGMTPKGLGIFTYVEVEDVDKQFELITKSGIKPSSKPKSFPWGKREFAIKDPDGFKIVMYQNL